jgi:integrase
LSDTHIGGAAGSDIFESPAELTELLDDLGGQDGPVELVLAGDFLDLLRMGDASGGGDRVAPTIARPEYRELFAALRAFARAPGAPGGVRGRQPRRRDLVEPPHPAVAALADCRQADLDLWLATGPTQRRAARSFYHWASDHRHAPTLDFPPETRGLRGGAITDDQRWAIARRILHDPDIDVADRVAGALIVLYGQTVTKVTRLTIDDITIADDRTTVRLGTTPIDVGEPLASHLRQLVATRRWTTAARIPDPPAWLFPGAPGRCLSPNHLARRLRAIGVDTASRRTALLQLCGELPAAVIADLLGIHIGTAIAWSRAAGGSWAEYIDARRAGSDGEAS